jgi:hypothetical protein
MTNQLPSRDEVFFTLAGQTVTTELTKERVS